MLIALTLKDSLTDIYFSKIDSGLLLDICFKFTNGKSVYANKISEIPADLDFFGTMNVLHDFKPDDYDSIEMKSPEIPVEYVNYPVQQVFAQFYFEEAEDRVNNKTENRYLEAYDITDNWNRVVAAIKVQKLGRVN